MVRERESRSGNRECEGDARRDGRLRKGKRWMHKKEKTEGEKERIPVSCGWLLKPTVAEWL